MLVGLLTVRRLGGTTGRRQGKDGDRGGRISPAGRSITARRSYRTSAKRRATRDCEFLQRPSFVRQPRLSPTTATSRSCQRRPILCAAIATASSRRSCGQEETGEEYPPPSRNVADKSSAIPDGPCYNNKRGRFPEHPLRTSPKRRTVVFPLGLRPRLSAHLSRPLVFYNVGAPVG
jgi:hypothetical protein